MHIITVAVFNTEQAGAPHMFAGQAVSDVVSDVKHFFLEDMEIEHTCDQTALDAFNSSHSIDALKQWMSDHYCTFSLVRTVHSIR